MDHRWQRKSSGFDNCMNAAMNTNRRNHNSTKQCIIKGNTVILHSDHGLSSSSGKLASVWLYSRTEVDPATGRGKLSGEAYLKHGKTEKLVDGTKITTYKIKLQVEENFGFPGAFLIRNHNINKFFLQSAHLQVDDPHSQIVNFYCKSWVYPFRDTKTDRLFFSNTSYLPSQTPAALEELRKDELKSLRGDGTGERKEWDRIYDYDYYNNLGNPDNGRENSRPVLGGSESHPYPRRGRTGRCPSKQDSLTERQPDQMTNLNLVDIYIPPDEKCSPKKLSEFISNSIQAIVHFVIPAAKLLFEQDSATSFESFNELLDLYSGNKCSKVVEGGWFAEELKSLVPNEQFYKMIINASKDHHAMRIPIPQIIAQNALAWMDDDEFGRQMLAGMNPTVIRVLDKFPPRNKNGVQGSIKRSHIEHNLDGRTLKQAMENWRIFILEHHDYLMPFMEKINKNGICAYATRTLLFLRNDATLKPLAIEVSSPVSGSSPNDIKEINRVLLPAKQGTQAALWQLAKAHVAVNDSAYHQLITHWLKTHAVVEPFIIATRRQLSVMHPIHLLLDPHFKDTMHVNAVARSIILNSGGILEKTLFSGDVSMELSSMLYKDWRFDEQGLPSDLIKRGFALENVDMPAGVQLLFRDYPYAADGLEIWIAIESWVTDFCFIFYKEDASVTTDEELQAWWSEIRNVGHGDKRNETWWYQMTTRSDLIKTLTTLIWITSAHHASLNFGQYGYAGFPLNRPTLCRKFIPEEGTLEFAKFLNDPDQYYLNMLPERFEMTVGIALMEVLSRHASDEEYLGQRGSSFSSLEWTDNVEVQKRFGKFQEDLQNVEKRILMKNRNPNFKNRWGAAKVPYKLMYPDTSNTVSKGGITGKGIPNSISI